MTRLLVATTNSGKVAELSPILGELGFLACGLQDLPAVPEATEDGDSFAANAARKALHYSRHAGLPTLADDSGLQVEALGGAPGVYSARFAGPDADDVRNNALLLERLAGVRDRAARFVCALCLVEHDRISLEVEGTCEGVILDAPRGAGGFGYDPLFVPADGSARGRSFAELSALEKRRISHRGRALQGLAAALAARRPGTTS